MTPEAKSLITHNLIEEHGVYDDELASLARAGNRSKIIKHFSFAETDAKTNSWRKLFSHGNFKLRGRAGEGDFSSPFFNINRCCS